METTETAVDTKGADQSASIADLAAALAKAQGAMKAAAKDAENPHFRSKYADLASVWTACREPLSANGLAVMQRVRTSAEGVTVVTMLVHSSGEWVRDQATFPVVGPRTPQAIGSAITYARRYALSALVGVAADEDDDGNAASERHGPPPAARARARAREEAPSPPPTKEEARPEEPKAEKKPKQSPELRNRITRMWIAAKAKGARQEPFQAWAASVLGKAVSSSEWDSADVERLEHMEQPQWAPEEQPEPGATG